jgi:hypothetical protein
MPQSPTMMVQLHLPGGQPSLAEAAAALGLAAAELDAEFGVIATDPDRGLYAVRVAADAAARAEQALNARGVGGAEGLFSDPPIESAGPDDEL